MKKAQPARPVHWQGIDRDTAAAFDKWFKDTTGKAPDKNAAALFDHSIIRALQRPVFEPGANSPVKARRAQYKRVSEALEKLDPFLERELAARVAEKYKQSEAEELATPYGQACAKLAKQYNVRLGLFDHHHHPHAMQTLIIELLNLTRNAAYEATLEKGTGKHTARNVPLELVCDLLKVYESITGKPPTFWDDKENKGFFALVRIAFNAIKYPSTHPEKVIKKARALQDKTGQS